MASCCPGVTECEHVITIGFLNTFIGSDIQDSDGNATSAAGDDTYCPTYSELTGGTLIQNWKKGTTPNGDRDGIVIGGSYAANECVRREDLSMKYTRFKSLDVSASPLEIDACSGCSTLSFTHLYNRYEKKLNGSCEGGASPSVEEASDTVSGHVSYSSSNNVFSVSGNQVCVGKNNPNNNGRSNSRSTVITAKITFRGTDHTDTVTITQAGLTGTYKFWYSTYSTHDEGVTCTGGPNFGCAGGSYGATAYYYRDDWDVYRYQDKCGTNYNSDTEQRNRVNNQYRVYDTYSGSFSDKTGQCGTWPDSVSWPGYGSCSWTQTCNECGCEPPCDDCDSIAWGNGTYTGTIGCSGGRVRMNNITIPGTSYTWSYDDEISGCTVSTAETSTTRSTYVDIGCNTTTSQRTFSGTKNNISYSITQSAGPCCTPSVTYQYETVSLTCEAHENENVRAKYTAVTVDECCSTTYPTAYTEYYTVNVGCNSGNTRYLTDSEKSNAPFPVQQAGDSECCTTPSTCGCGDLTVGSTAEAWAHNVTTPKDITITSATCISSISVNSLTHFNATLGADKVTVSPKGNNTSTSAYVETLTVSYSADSTSCSSAITLTQGAPGYDCTSFSVVNQEVRYSHDDQGEVAVATINSSVGAGLFDSLTVTGSGGSSFSNLRTVVNGTSMTIYVTMAACTGDEKYDITATVNGQTCPIMSLYRICPCVTDNCLQTMTGLDYPLYIRACYEDCWVTLSNGQVVKKRSYTADSPYISNTDIFGNAALTESIYTGNIAEPITDVLVFSGMNADNTIWYSTDWSTYTGWYKDLGYGIHVIYYNNMFVYIADNSGGNSPVSVVSTYYTDGTKTLVGGPWSGKKACTASTTTIVLARNGYEYKKTGPYDPAKGEKTYEEYSLGYTCENCGSTPPTPTQCQVSMALINSAEAAGGYMYIGEWHSTGSCTVTSTLTYVSGDGDFLSSTDVRSNGGIYATLSANSSQSSRTSRYRITYGTATAEADITQLGGSGPQPTTYTYTVTTDAGGEGAVVNYWATVGGSTSIVHNGTISNGSCVFSTSTDYGEISIVIVKEGCTFSSATGGKVNPNGSVAFTSSCSSPDPCTLSVNITDAFFPGTGGCQVVGTFTTGGSCAGQTPTATYNGTLADFITAWTFNTTTGQIAACADYNPSETYSRGGGYTISVGTASQDIALYQAVYDCNCQAETTVTASISQTTFGPDGGTLNLGTFSTSCPMGCDWNLLGFDGGESWFSIEYEPIGRQSLGGRIYINMQALPSDMNSRTGTFELTYNNEWIGGTITITQTR